jgi:uncharacterized protein (TIGR00369 family)
MDDDTIAGSLRERIAESPLHSGLGLEVTAASIGAVELEMPATTEQLNLLGAVHGGVLATLADTAMGLAIRTEAGEERRHVTIDMDIRFLRAAGTGTLRATGRAIKVGARIAFAEAEIRDGRGAVLARASGTYDVGAIRPVGQ